MPAAFTVAFVAGMLAAFNPCGFALLPAYLALLVTGDESSSSDSYRSIVRAGRFSAGMTVGFVLTFGILGLAVAPVLHLVSPYLPFVTVVIGLTLVLAGIAMFRGRSFGVSWFHRPGRPPTGTFTSAIGYGAAFALASLSCTIGPFLAVVTNSLRIDSTLAATLTFVVYALGMGTVVLGLALTAALASSSAVRSMRRATPIILRVSAILLLVSGTYVLWYGVYEIRILRGWATGDPLVDSASSLQAAVSEWMRTNVGLVAMLTAVAVVACGLVIGQARRRSSDQGTARAPR